LNVRTDAEKIITIAQNNIVNRGTIFVKQKIILENMKPENQKP
jgi:hypothetical protein